MKHWSLAVVLFLLALPILWYVREHDPRGKGFFPPCILYKVTGIHCPGCGGTRAAHSLLNGDVLAAIAWNPFLIIGLPIVIAAIAYDKRLRDRGHEGLKYLSLVVAVSVIAFFVLRNIPNPENGWLAPKDLELRRASSSAWLQ